MSKKTILDEHLILTESVNISALVPVLDKIKDKLQQLDMDIENAPSEGSSAEEGVSENVLSGTSELHEFSYFQDGNMNLYCTKEELMQKRAVHREFLEKLGKDWELEIEKAKNFLLEVSLVVFQENGVICFEIFANNKTYYIEIKNGYPVYVGTYDNYFDLYVSGKFFQFVNGELSCFDAFFELQYPWPVFVPKTGEILYKNKKVLVQKIHVRIN